ncbi:MAG: hypothetical protein ABIY51_13580 [Ferruginibacter sp.]
MSKKLVERDGTHDFDFELGRWQTHLRRLANPLSGDPGRWVEYTGTTVVTKLWEGKSNIVELVADGPAGHFEGLSLRLYDPQAHQWSLHFANAKNGMMTAPTLGKFTNGIGEFYNQDDFNGKIIFVKFIIKPLDKDNIRFEQSFSNDGGKTWELNWVATDTRIK